MSIALMLWTLAAAPSASCEPLLTAVEQLPDPPDLIAVLQLAERLPPEAKELRLLVRERAASSGALPAREVLALGLLDGCGEAADAKALREEADAVLSAEGIDAIRKGEDALDYLLRKAGVWFMQLMESEGMQDFALVVRPVFLGILALLILLIAWRLARRRVRQQRAAKTLAEALRIERSRVLAFAEWREAARAHLAEGETRQALRAGQMALLARVGEVEPGAVRPARTGREILESLDEDRASLCQGPLLAFERAYFSGHAGASDAGVFLDAVDAAAAALAALRGRRAGSR